MIFSDLHTHSFYCDGKNSPEEMVLSAIKKGLKKIGIVIHAYIPDATYCVKLDKIEEFKKEIKRLKEKYFGKIEVLCGVEMDLYSNMSTEGFDYIIGSVHYFSVNGKLFDVDYNSLDFEKTIKEQFDGDYYSATENYFSSVGKICEIVKPNIIGHLDLVSKFNENNKFFDEKNPRYERAWKGAVDKLLKYNIPFEINLGAISRGYKSVPYPSLDMIKYIKENGGKFILSSDAHIKNDIAKNYIDWAYLVK